MQSENFTTRHTALPAPRRESPIENGGEPNSGTTRLDDDCGQAPAAFALALRVERREPVPAIGAERQGIDLRDRFQIEIAIEMREQGAAA